ncbi:hypothetical protein [Klebsiella michiganensis]|uniref:Uncharacterized protein n=1 Tax=Klebsiella michiganensis TaxID=1134687 RepID=A0A6P1V715_9ENTR|nr:hypothetical protein [Klebsiella michiganensis]MXJ80514.1 hypothetical protein [Klebsiella michiganensis]QHS48896.1 hypothetical protein GW952_26385 [Klebsiella michiganensis]
MAWWKDLSKDSISGVIVTLVTGGSGIAVIVWLWNYIKKFFHWLVDIFVYPVTLPVWALLLISISLLVLLPTVGFVLRRKVTSEANNHLESFLDYKTDTIFGILVSWRWVRRLGSQNYSLDSLTMRCPVCSGMLVQHANDLYNLNPYPLIKCQIHGCDWKISRDFERLTYGDMRIKLEQEIDRRCFQRFGD